VKAVILNSGIGSRMGELTENKPKCLVSFDDGETILSRQITQLLQQGITEIIITIGPYGDMIPDYVSERFPGQDITWIRNEKYDTTNYIYSMFLADHLIREDILLLHGDLVFDSLVLKNLIEASGQNLAIVDSTAALLEKDFKCKISEGSIREISIHIDTKSDAYFLLPLYKLSQQFMVSWMDEIGRFVADGNVKVYAENAFNEISESLNLSVYDKKGAFCMEVDTAEDFEIAKGLLDA